MGKNNQSDKKGQFGLTLEDAQQLRKIMREAAERHGEQVVVSKLGFDTLTAACEAVSKNMTRAEYGKMCNTVLKLDGPRVKVNKYADKVAARRLVMG